MPRSGPSLTFTGCFLNFAVPFAQFTSPQSACLDAMVDPRLMTRSRVLCIVLAGVGLTAAFAIGADRVLPLRDRAGHTPLARAGDVQITSEEFRGRYVEYLVASGVHDDPALRQQFLGDMIATQLLVQEERKAGIARTEAYHTRKRQLRRKLLIEVFLQETVLDTVRTRDMEVRAMFVRANTELEASHLFARTRAEADALYERLKQGDSFEDLARENFEDPALRDTGGSLGTFGWDEMDAAFEDAAFALPVGGVSEPVRTAQGWSIIRLDDRFTKPILTETEYAEKRPLLEAYVLRRKHELARRAFARIVADENRTTFEEDALTGLLDQITGARILHREKDMLRLLKQPLLTFGPPSARRTWTVEEFRDRAGQTSDKQRARVRMRQDLIDFASGLVTREVLVSRAQALGLEDTRRFAEALAEALDQYILDQIRTRFRAEATVPEDSARSYYAQAPATEFVREPQVRIAERYAPSRAVLDASDAAWRDRGYRSKRELGAHGDAAFAATAGAVIGPVETPAGTVWLKVGDNRPRAAMTFEEARGQIEAMLHLRYARNNRREAYEAVRARYNIDIDEALLSTLSLRHAG